MTANLLHLILLAVICVCQSWLRTPDDVRDRIQWHEQCVRSRIWQGRADDQPLHNHAWGDSAPALQSYNALKWHAFWVWSRTEPLRQYPVRQVSFGPPLWLEQQWERHFARPVRLCVDPGLYAEQMRAATLVLNGTLPESAVSDGIPSELPLLPDGSCPSPGVWVEEPFDYALFHPFVPLFVHWDDIVVAIGGSTPHAASLALAGVLEPLIRPDARYITVQQRGGGPITNDFPALRHLTANLLILNQGGRGGHVPLPLLATEHPVDTSPAPEPRSCVLGFVGSIWEGARSQTLAVTKASPKWRGRYIIQATNTSSASAWKSIMKQCMFQLAPRGTNPSSFRLYEALQLGHIPVYVWEDVLWLPYTDMVAKGRPHCRAWLSWQPWQGGPDSVPPECRTLWHDIGIVVHVKDYHDWLTHPQGLSRLVQDTAWQERAKSTILAVRDSYFTYDGVLGHMRQLFEDPRTAQLQCAP